ncbi:HlyD family type I secretion periplasmic adaptor subunit [Endozoicomonas sp. SESOKO4]|uniref:HlyD family type I secretion periplasmic adaptor subunit n=1 Tax=Endozoicomonas sp. SESOKO4 TaxID=2828745 RepID=UPI0021480E91|nr:HlyD family type I secretion periplasmic adaptor subunit [Endozoicomonas sp. SESOKO4]
MKEESRWQRWLLETAGSRDQARLLDLSVYSRWFVWMLLAFLVVLILWSCWAELDEVVTGYGRVVPDSRVQLVQSLDGGILKWVGVREGDHVNRGDTLVQVDETRYRSNLMVNETELEDTAWEVLRLEVELNSLHEKEGQWQITRSELPDKFHAEPVDLMRLEQQNAILDKRLESFISQLDILSIQESQKSQELKEHRQKIKTLSRSDSLIEEELKLKEPLVREGLVTQVDILGLQRRANELKGELESAKLMEPRLASALSEARSRYRSTAVRYRADVQKELQSARERLGRLTEGQVGLKDKVHRTSLSAPVSGLIKVVHVNTPGSVIQPGATLIEIVPEGDSLVVEAQVKPSDIAFLRSGQNAQVKLTAYENASYGSLKGTLESISADTLEDDRGQPYYRIRVKLPTTEDQWPVLPGMTAVVDVLTGSRTVMNYLMAPVLKAIQ